MTKKRTKKPWVGVVMGSESDYKTLKLTCKLLDEFHIPYEAKVVSAHRTPKWMFDYAMSAEKRGLKVIIAAAGGAAHLPGMVASLTLLPVLGVPIKSKSLDGLDSLLSIAQMPKGIPVGTLAIGNSGAANAALLAAAIISDQHPKVRDRLRKWRARQTSKVLKQKLK